MSRHVKLDFEFNNEKFSEILRKAQGNRQQKEFAEQIGMNKSYLNCYLTGNIDHPLSPPLLLRIALVAENSVTLEELLTVSGYDPDYFVWNDKHIKRVTNKNKVSARQLPRLEGFERFLSKESSKEAFKISQKIYAISGTITNALAEHEYKWSGVNKKAMANSATLDLLIAFYEQPIQHWGFLYLVEKNQFGWEDGNKTVDQLAPILLNSMTEPGDKFSFVTTDEKIFDYYSKQSFPVLSLYMSLILIDPTRMKVVKEIAIPTSCKEDGSIPKLC